MISIANTAQVRAAITAMLKVDGVSKCASECGDTNKGVGMEVAIGKEVATVKAVALELGDEPSAPLPGRSKYGWE